MGVKLIASTEAQNNFGRLLDDVVQNGARYVIRRRNSAQAIILSVADLESILSAGEAERAKLEKLVRELGPTYTLGEAVEV